MKKQIIILIPLLILFLLSACSQKKPPHHPKNPNYKIIKPKVKYKPSKKNLEKMVKKLQGSPYVWAEEGPYNFDCSGFTYYMYGSMGIDIPRVSRHQAKRGKRIAVKDLQYGDLIFFATSKRSSKKITHVGMYMGDGWFTHASTVKNEVIYSNLFTSPYYKKRLRICRRYLPDTPKKSPKKSLSKLPRQASWTKASPVAISQDKKPTPVTSKAIVMRTALKERSSTNANYYVQVGSFIGSPSPSIIYSIKRHGFMHKIITYPRGAKQISKLLIGPYRQMIDATEALKTVKKQIQKDAFIAEIR